MERHLHRALYALAALGAVLLTYVIVLDCKC